MTTTQEYCKRRSTAKGNLTRVISQIETREDISPDQRDRSALDHLYELLQRAEDAYSSNYQSLDEFSAKEEDAYLKFTRLVDNSRLRISVMTELRESYRLFETLSQEVEDWEESDVTDQSDAFLAELPRLQKSLNDFRISTCSTGASSISSLKDNVKDLRRRLTKLKQTATTATLSSDLSAKADKESSENLYRHERRARTVPLPTFKGDLADWRSFWRRFQEYVDKLKGITDDEKLTYLQECLKDPVAQDIVADSIRNGDVFEVAEEHLHKKYDQPREVYTEALRGLIEMPSAAYSRNSLAAMVKDFNKFRNILLRYGDGTADQVFTAIMETRMSHKLLEEWKLFTHDGTTIPSGSKLIDFCDKRELILSSSEKDRNRESKSQHLHAPFKTNTGPSTGKSIKPQISLHANDFSQCKYCRYGNHPLYLCSEFKALDVPSRYQTLQSLQVCFNCLGVGHTWKHCPNKGSCKECGGRHHTLIHRPDRSDTATVTSRSEPSATQTNSQATSLALGIPDKTALVWSRQVLLDVDGHSQVVRAMIDTGSTLSFLTGKVATALKAKRIPFATTITGLAQSHAATSNYKVNVTLKAFNNPEEPPLQLSPLIVSSITGNTPVNDLSRHKDLEFTKNLKLADQGFGSPGKIDLLLGQDIIHRIMRQGFMNSPNSELYSVNTMFGWVIGGYCASPSQVVTAHICCKASVDGETNNLLRAFWETEEMPSDMSHLSQDNQLAIAHFKDTVAREKDGRYIVQLPKKESAPVLGNSRAQAVRRYEHNERMLLRRGKWSDFKASVEEYALLGHAEVVPAADLSKPVSQMFYMPMHGVVKEMSTTTKLRVVFNASARTSSGYSLNDTLLTGPTLYPLLTNILISFRRHVIGMSADISKMFREVSLHPADRDLHRYVFKDETGKYQDWRMTRVTFGVTSSPFLATQVLRQLAENHEQEFPEAAALIHSSFYVDDCLTGASNLQEAEHIRVSLNQLLDKAKMTLRKWRTNSSELRAGIPVKLLEKEEIQLISAPSECHKTLGIHWDTTRDTLHVATPTLDGNDLPTKRHVLSDVARTFDVLGWFSPVTVTLKILLQKIWHLGIDWDESLPSELINSWQIWRKELPLITAFPIARHYFHSDKEKLNISTTWIL